MMNMTIEYIMYVIFAFCCVYITIDFVKYWIKYKWFSIESFQGCKHNLRCYQNVIENDEAPKIKIKTFL